MSFSLAYGIGMPFRNMDRVRIQVQESTFQVHIHGCTWANVLVHTSLYDKDAFSGYAYTNSSHQAHGEGLN
jgi:hypothetical protein